MKQIIQNIDTALKTIYELDTEERADDFLLNEKPKSISETARQGALYIQDATSEVTVGIYLNPEIKKNLESLEAVAPNHWDTVQLNAFAVASEEISHFHYLLYRLKQSGGVSQIELETQGEIDKFFLCFFASVAESTEKERVFETLYEKCFYEFQLANNLTEAEKNRYVDANIIAKAFVQSTKSLLTKKDTAEALKKLRQFYRLPSYEKLSFRVGK